MDPEIKTIVYTNGWRVEFDYDNETERAFDANGAEQPLPPWHLKLDEALDHYSEEMDDGEWPVDKIEVLHSGSEEEVDEDIELYKSSGGTKKNSGWTGRKSKH